MTFAVRSALICVLIAGLSGCGLKGPLYLPETATNVEIRPAAGVSTPATRTESTPASVTAPEDEDRPESDRESPTEAPRD
ncbi:MAG TPA: lipoprotein [Steroidobacteraceae bacterium]|nr:lipoprotein [Steroidobacteraceae bacterium]